VLGFAFASGQLRAHVRTCGPAGPNLARYG